MTPLRFALPVVISEQIDAMLGDGTVDELSARLGELGEGAAVACVLEPDGRVYLSIRWSKGWSDWWIVTRDASGGLMCAGPTGDPGRCEGGVA